MSASASASSSTSSKPPKTAAELEAGRLQFEANKLTAETLGEWRLGDSQVWARVNVFGGKVGVDIREMFEGKDGNWYPSKSGKGIRLNEYKWNALMKDLTVINQTLTAYSDSHTKKPLVKPPAKPGKTKAVSKTAPAATPKKRKIVDEEQEGEDAEMEGDGEEDEVVWQRKPKPSAKPSAKPKTTKTRGTLDVLEAVANGDE